MTDGGMQRGGRPVLISYQSSPKAIQESYFGANSHQRASWSVRGRSRRGPGYGQTADITDHPGCRPNIRDRRALADPTIVAVRDVGCARRTSRGQRRLSSFRTTTVAGVTSRAAAMRPAIARRMRRQPSPATASVPPDRVSVGGRVIPGVPVAPPTPPVASRRARPRWPTSRTRRRRMRLSSRGSVT